jgi:hypothetical protein
MPVVVTVTLAAVEAIKSDLRRALPDVKSSHRIEAAARGLGWATNAAMRAELANSPARCVPDRAIFESYLARHGFFVDGRHLIRSALRLQIRAVMEANPELTPRGFGVCEEGRIGLEERLRRIEAGREEMLGDAAAEEFERACEYLAALEMTEKPNRRLNTYDLKHGAERFHRRRGNEGRWDREYVSNGMLIAAACHLGFTVHRPRGSWLAKLNVSSASVELLNDEGRPELLQPEGGAPFRVLGHDRGIFYYLLAGQRRPTAYRVAEHTKSKLLHLAPLEFWSARHPAGGGRAGFDRDQAISALFQEAHQVGIFDPDRWRWCRGLSRPRV